MDNYSDSPIEASIATIYYLGQLMTNCDGENWSNGEYEHYILPHQAVYYMGRAIEEISKFALTAYQADLELNHKKMAKLFEENKKAPPV